MTPLVEICLVLVTAGFLVVSFVTVRALLRFEKAADEFSRTAQAIQRSMALVEDVTREMHDLVSTVGKATPPLRRAIAIMGEVGERLARLCSAVMEEVETPVRNALAVAQGVRSGAAFFVNRIAAHRSSPRHDHLQENNQGGLGHV